MDSILFTIYILSYYLRGETSRFPLDLPCHTSLNCMVQGSNVGICQTPRMSIPTTYSGAGENNCRMGSQTHETYCDMDLGQNTICYGTSPHHKHPL